MVDGEFAFLLVLCDDGGRHWKTADLGDDFLETTRS